MSQALKAINVVWLHRVYTLLVTLWAFLGQVLSQAMASPSATARRQEAVVQEIRQAYPPAAGLTARRRVHRELVARGANCSEKTAAKLMRREGIRSKTRRRFVVRTTDSRHGHPIAPNRLGQAFKQSIRITPGQPKLRTFRRRKAGSATTYCQGDLKSSPAKQGLSIKCAT